MMIRSLALALVVLIAPAVQAVSVLHIKVAVVDANGQSMPVPRFRLQVSDNPPSALPKRIITSLDGTVDVRLPAGTYSVESERPLIVGGKSYQWSVVVEVALSRDSRIELTHSNAEIGAAGDLPDTTAPPLDADPSTLLGRWKDSVVAIWTATTHGSGFLIDPSGLLVADQQVIGAATAVEVQLSQAVKVAGAVVASDAARGVALIRVNPAVTSSMKVLSLGCDQAPGSLAVAQEIVALEAPLSQLRGTRAGVIESILPNFIDTDLVTSVSGSGGPVFAPDGRLIGLTSQVRERDDHHTHRARVVRVRRVCEFIDSAGEKIKSTAPPSADRLPVESVTPAASDSSC
jgi:hypothetical protein